MNRMDRALGILLALRCGKPLSASELSRRFEVSTRTIYRDIEVLSSVGVPVYAEMGRAGGFRLVEGYFLPPVMFSVREAISLVLGLSLLSSLRASPFAVERETGAQKLLAAMPDHLRAVLAEAQKMIGFEQVAGDAFHFEPARGGQPATSSLEGAGPDEAAIVDVFLQAILERRAVVLDYRSPYGAGPNHVTLRPCGLLWDRDLWYLVGRRADRDGAPRLWRADRVLAIRASATSTGDAEFDVRALLGRSWLQAAMDQWRQEAPVVIRLERGQAERLKRDWYYRHARFEELPGEQVLMTFGESNREIVFELLRWLGPGAELIEPAEWRAALRDELAQMLVVYAEDVDL
jgi:predicted DNA-binding transcriptional regulator YafY